MANVWCVQNGLEGGALVRGLGWNQGVGFGRCRSPAAAFVSGGARGRREWSKLGLRITTTVAAAHPTDLEAGNVERLDLSKQEENAQGGPQGNAILDLPPQSHADQRRREQQFASILQVCIFVNSHCHTDPSPFFRCYRMKRQKKTHILNMLVCRV